ncbi:hypothetical protein DID96_03575 [Burkholderia sp. Bp8963]|uniref:hypothetical protein n=1 Tax=Burkholderia sp. Bp8963 TaxID=2184547 RepID=UPI000F594CC0|nr:hypothetical protein [Burkholderia sp. Bp8963]RQS75511.1 hypothetical protein DID96_03575 [Burkholderia sp. Bp8963]
MMIELFAPGYLFEVDVNGYARGFHVGVVCRDDCFPTNIQFSAFDDFSDTWFSIPLPGKLWTRAKSDGLEEICRRAISHAIKNGWFGVSGNHEYGTFDETAEVWPGMLEGV